MIENLGFTGNPLDRLSQLRDDATALAALESAPDARAVALVQGMSVVRAEGEDLFALHPLALARGFGAVRQEVLLGRDAGGPVFALWLTDDSAMAEELGEAAGFLDQRRLVLPAAPQMQVRDLRAMAHKDHLSRAERAILAQAKAILHYHASHGFCARCGAATQPVQAGWRRDCTACGAQHFPRTDPVVIMHVVNGESCLLGRQKHFPPGMYSCLAGFIEAGETLEEAVRREVLEEAGIEVAAVSYRASQPWPYPASLMFGCRAQATSRAIEMDRIELEDCRWFTRDEVRAMLAETHPEGCFAPAKIAIARSLMEEWAEEG
jgi:NAD+ diphosphatase